MASRAWDVTQPSLAKASRAQPKLTTWRLGLGAHAAAPALSICLSWQKEKCLASFTCEQTKMKHLGSLLRPQVYRMSWDEAAACNWGLSRSCLRMHQAPLRHSTRDLQGQGEATGSAGGCTARSSLKHSISSQGSKTIIDFILIGLSAMSQFKC